AIHKAGRALYNFNVINHKLIHLDAVLITPLLAFLPHAIKEGENPVKAKSVDIRLGNIRSSRESAQAWDFIERFNSVCRGIFLQILVVNDYRGNRIPAHFGSS